MSEFPVFRLKSFKHYGPKNQTTPGAHLVSQDFKLRDKTKHLVVIGLGLIDEGRVLDDKYIERAVAACAAAWRADEGELFRCSVCQREFDEMPPDGLHTVIGGECGPVYEVAPAALGEPKASGRE